MTFTNANADSWYAFCTTQSFLAAEREESEAALVWWCLRMLDDIPIGDPEDPCTDPGFAELSEYYGFKLERA